MTNPASDEKTNNRPLPPIISEVDIPIVSESSDEKAPDQRLNQTDDMSKNLTIFRYRTGKTVLYVSMGVMIGLVIIELVASRVFNTESDLVKNAFEAFKLITMTVLGYIFGSNDSKSA